MLRKKLIAWPRKYGLSTAFVITLLIVVFLYANAFASAFENQTHADAAYEDARALITKNDYPAAITKLSPFMSDPLKYPRPVSDYIVLLVWTGRADDAIKAYESLPEAFTKPGYLQRNIAKAYLDKRNIKSAASLYQSALSSMPDDTEALKGLSLSLAELGEYDKAVASIETLIEKKPDDAEVKVLHSTILFNAGRYTEAVAAFRAASAFKSYDSEKILRERDRLLLSLPEDKKKSLADRLSITAVSGRNAAADYIVLLAMTGRYSDVVAEFENLGTSRMQSPFDMLNWVAWSYFKTDARQRAKDLYTHVLSTQPLNRQALIGLSYCLSADRQAAKAAEILDRLHSSDPSDIDVLFARAYAFERSGEFIDAVKTYDTILSRQPGNISVKKLRLMAIADLGANTHAIEQIKNEMPGETGLLDELISNTAVDRLKWNENIQALGITAEQQKKRTDLRARFDHIAALAENKDMADAVKQYESLVKSKSPVPAWVTEYAAGAYLYLEQPLRAFDLYSEALQKDPSSYKARLGILHTLREMRRWKDAEKVLLSLERELEPPRVNSRPNFGKLYLAYDRGWFLLSQDRLQEAEDHFWRLYTDAPGNNEGRSGLAHTHYFRGWPRKAYEEFRIITGLEPEEVGYKTGLIMTMNSLDLKNEAREEAQKLLVRYPKEKPVQALARSLKVQDMDEITASFTISSEEGGFGDVKYFLSYSHAFTPYTRAYAFVNHERSRDSDQKNHFRRIGAGASHIFSRYLSAVQQFSVNYDDAKDIGSLTSVSFTPDDRWTISASFDSYTSDVPFRARVTGISSKKYDLAVAYRESELSDYNLAITRYDFSDNNKRDMLNLGHSRQVFLSGDWKMRLFFNYYTSGNSLQNADYFNPDSDWKFSVTHMTEHVIKSMYRQSWIHRLYLTAGFYEQSGYSGKLDTAIRYEHDIAFSDTQSLLIGASFGRNNYDGSPSNAYTFYLTYRGRL